MNIFKYIKHPTNILIKLSDMNLIRLTDEYYISLKYKQYCGHKLNLDNPITFTEKLQWLKLYDKNDLYTTMVDKYKVKDYIAKKIGKEYVVPLLGVWDNPDDIDFDSLPNKFVLKCNHNSGLGMCICRDKSKLNIKQVKKSLKKGLEQDYYKTNREWTYKNVERKIIAEEYLEDGKNEDLTDYKFFCFNGVPYIMYVSKDNAKVPETDFYDMDYNHLNLRMKDKNSEKIIECPKHFEKMKDISKKLSKDIPFLRVDFYNINNKLYVGELTFYHNAGFFAINPPEWDYKLGDLLDIRKVSK